jgi:hypothetical protein
MFAICDTFEAYGYRRVRVALRQRALSSTTRKTGG